MYKEVFTSIEAELPQKGKEIIAICDDGLKRELYRCPCKVNPKCMEWRCSITGMNIIVDVFKWRYAE